MPLPSYRRTSRGSPERRIEARIEHLKHNINASRDNLQTEIKRFQGTTDALADIVATMTCEDVQFVKAFMERVTDCEEGVRHLQQISTGILDFSDEFIKLIESQSERIQEMKESTTEILQQLALRQICSSTKAKVFREIAGERLHQWEALHITTFKNLAPEKLRGIVKSEDDFSYFHSRWIRLKEHLGITENEGLLQRMYAECMDEGKKLAHGDYKFIKDELSEFIMKQANGGLRNALLTFIKYDEKISQLRNDENIYEYEWMRCYME